MKKILLFLCTISSFCLSAQTPIASAQTGDYNVGSTWVGGVVPSAVNLTTPVIKNGHIVTVDVSTSIYDGLKVESGGTITVNNATVAIPGGSFIIQSGGTLNANNALFTPIQILINSGAVVNWSNSTFKCPMDNAGTFNWLAGDINAGTPSSYFFANQPTGILNDNHSGNNTWYNTQLINYSTYPQIGVYNRNGASGSTTFTTDGSNTVGHLENNGTVNIPVNNTIILTKQVNLGGTFNIAGTLRVAGNSIYTDLGFAGDNLFLGTGTVAFENGAVFRYAGGIISIANVSLDAATMSGSANITYSAGTTLTLTNSTLSKHNNSPNQTILGTLVLNGSNTISANLPVFFTGGTMTNNGTLTLDPTASFTLNGSTQQTLNGIGTISLLTLNNANNLTITGNHTINTLALTAGKVNISTNNLTVGTLLGYSATQYIVTSAAGELRQSVGNTNIFYPVGITSAYNPVTLKDNANTNTYGVSVKQGFAITNQPVGTDWVDRQWTITKTTALAASTDAIFQWNSPSEQQGSFNTNLCAIGHYGGGVWDYNTAAAATCGSGICTRTRTGLTSFSPFGIFSGAVLPVEFVDFKGTPQYKSVLLSWSTAHELNNKGFQIERSRDGKMYENIGSVSPQPPKGELHRYEFLDESPLWGLGVYYRLRQIDMDGKETVSKVISVRMDNGKGKISLSPNPAKDHISIVISDNNAATIRLFDLLGRLILSKNTNEGTTDLDISSVLVGHYLLEIATNGQLLREKLVKN